MRKTILFLLLALTTSGAWGEAARPRKSIPTLCPWKRGNSLESVNSKVGIWAPACSLIIQEVQANHPRLASLPSKSCSYCNHEDALKLSFGGKLAIFTSHQVKQLLNGKGHLWISDQSIVRYQVMMMENPSLTISPCEVLNPATLLPTPKDSLPFHSYLETLDKTPRGIVRRSSDQSWGNLVHWWKQLCLGWKKKSWICSSLQFWDHSG